MFIYDVNDNSDSLDGGIILTSDMSNITLKANKSNCGSHFAITNINKKNVGTTIYVVPIESVFETNMMKKNTKLKQNASKPKTQTKWPLKPKPAQEIIQKVPPAEEPTLPETSAPAEPVPAAEPAPAPAAEPAQE